MTFSTKDARFLRTLGISFPLLNATLWLAMPAIRALVDSALGRQPPMIVHGVQELLVYYDPWLSLWVFPPVFTFGLAAIPFLRKQIARQSSASFGGTYSVVMAVVLIGLELVWLFLIAVGVILRGPNWSIFWPWEPWGQFKVEPLNNLDLSEYFWILLMDRPRPQLWSVRELPGLLLIGGYLLAGSAVAYCLYKRWQQVTPYWRCLSLVLLIQLAALVPTKMLLSWGINLKYFIAIPEYFFNV